MAFTRIGLMRRSADPGRLQAEGQRDIAVGGGTVIAGKGIFAGVAEQWIKQA